MSRIRIRGFQSVDKLYVIWGKGYDKLKKVTLRGNDDNGVLVSGPFEGKVLKYSKNFRSATVEFDEIPAKTDKVKELDDLAELEVTVYGENEEDSETSDP